MYKRCPGSLLWQSTIVIMRKTWHILSKWYYIKHQACLILSEVDRGFVYDSLALKSSYNNIKYDKIKILFQKSQLHVINHYYIVSIGLWIISSGLIKSPNIIGCLSLVGQSWSNFICSITGVGERLRKVLGQIGSKVWFQWQQKAPIDL